MSFQRDAGSIRSKLHLSHVPRQVLIGVPLVILCLLGVAVYTFMQAAQPAVVISSEDSQFANEDAAGDTVEAATVYVHVGGAVSQPGLYEIPEGARVADALEAAGGLSENAAADSINLARVVNDGEQILVPTVEEQQAQQQAVSSGGGSAGSVGGNAKVNINTADAALLDTLPGIGQATAEKIIADREANGPFSSIEDLKRVSGIGDAKYQELAHLITV